MVNLVCLIWSLSKENHPTKPSSNWWFQPNWKYYIVQNAKIPQGSGWTYKVFETNKAIMYNRSIPPTWPVRHHSRIQILIHLEALLQAGDTVALYDGNRNLGKLGKNAIIQNRYDMWMVSLDQIGISKKTAIGSTGVAY